MVTIEDVEDALPLRQAADVMHMHPDTLRRIVKAQGIDVLRIGSGRGRIFITRRAMADYLARSNERAAR